MLTALRPTELSVLEISQVSSTTPEGIEAFLIK